MSSLTKTWKTGRVLRLNLLMDQTNKAFAKEINVERTPTFILFDSKGKETKRWVGEVPGKGELP